MDEKEIALRKIATKGGESCRDETLNVTVALRCSQDPA
eukprot:COSAG02_NODE_1653_length_11488_cov_66.480815_7_plen_38_part_00